MGEIELAYVYRFDGVGPTAIANAHLVQADARLATYLSNVRPHGGVTYALNPTRAYVVVASPMSTLESAAWVQVLGASIYTLLGNYSGDFKDGNVEFVSL